MKPDWLQDMPREWKQVPFGSIFKQSKRKNTLLERDFVLSVTKDRGVIPYTEKGNIGNKVSDDLSGYKIVDKGDFVLNSMNLYMGSVGVSRYDGVTSTAYIVCKPSEDINAGYYNYLIQFKGFQEFVGFLGKGIMEIREAVRWTALKSVFVPLPDLDTQRAIAEFLDRETARIDKLISRKQRFLAVLEQKWAATVTSAVTCGLDSEVQLKETHLSSVGRIPEHWEVARLGHIGRCANGINIGGEAFGSGTPFVSYGDVYKNPELPSEVAGLVEATPEDRSRYSVKAGDVFFTRTSETIEEIGFSSACTQDIPDAVFAGFLIRFRPYRKKLVPLFSKYLFRNEALRAFFSKEMMIVTRASLSQGLLQKLPVLLPPLKEQEEIASHLQEIENKHLSISRKTQESIEGLREYRSALITSAVTGQIDVMTWGKEGSTDCRLEKIEEEMSLREVRA